MEKFENLMNIYFNQQNDFNWLENNLEICFRPIFLLIAIYLDIHIYHRYHFFAGTIFSLYPVKFVWQITKLINRYLANKWITNVNTHFHQSEFQPLIWWSCSQLSISKGNKANSVQINWGLGGVLQTLCRHVYGESKISKYWKF